MLHLLRFLMHTKIKHNNGGSMKVRVRENFSCDFVTCPSLLNLPTFSMMCRAIGATAQSNC